MCMRFLVVAVVLLVLVSCSPANKYDNLAQAPVTGYAIRVDDGPIFAGVKVKAPHMPSAFLLNGAPEEVNPVTDYSAVPLTGMVVSKSGEDMTVGMTPSTVAAGQTVTINVNPTSAGAYRYVLVYRENGVFKTTLELPCVEVCTDSVSKNLDIPATWAPGGYEVRVFDYASQTWQKSEFVVERGNDNVPYIYTDTPSSSGAVLFVHFNGGSEGFGPVMTIYRDDRLMMAYQVCERACSGEKSVGLDVPASWPAGMYTLHYIDYNDPKRQAKSLEFEIVGGGQVFPLDVTLQSPAVQRGSELRGVVSKSTYGASEVYAILAKDGSIVREGYFSVDDYRIFDRYEFAVFVDLDPGEYFLSVYDYQQERPQSLPFSVFE